MSLNWSIDNVQDWETTCKEDDGSLNAVTNALIWATMGIGLGEITEANLDEFAWRLHLYQQICGRPLVVTVEDDEFVPRPITYDDVKAHVGLRTNVSRETRAQWLKRTAESSFNDFVRDRKIEKERV